MLLAIIHEKTCHAFSPIQIFALKLAQRFLILLLVLFSHSSFADTVWLKNGDKISGTLVNKITNKVVIKTTYAGDIKLNWADIRSVDTAQTLQMMLTDGSIISGKLVQDEEGLIVIDSETNTPLINTELEDIQYVNPS